MFYLVPTTSIVRILSRVNKTTYYVHQLCDFGEPTYTRFFVLILLSLRPSFGESAVINLASRGRISRISIPFFAPLTASVQSL